MRKFITGMCLWGAMGGVMATVGLVAFSWQWWCMVALLWAIELNAEGK